MDKKSRSASNISLDSLEVAHNKKSPLQGKLKDDNVDTILVPFYENDVLIKVPKGNKKLRQTGDTLNKRNAQRETQQPTGYLINKNFQKGKKISYLETFRKQFLSNFNEKINKDPNEIRSISPEVGDTERESFAEDYSNNGASDFFNTEAYNEMYYQQVMNQELEQYLNQSFEDRLRFDEDIRSKSQDDGDDNNLRSVSEVSRPRRHVRRTTVPIVQNVKLGGLGPDMENIRPRLERAKSLQRYSEKVRMENRLKIYKKEMEAENEKKAKKEPSVKSRSSSANKTKEQNTKKSSYLIDKTQENSLGIKMIYNKSKSDVKELNVKDKDTNNNCNKNLKEKESKSSRVIERKLLSAKDNIQKYLKAGYETTMKRGSARSHSVNTEEKRNTDVSPVEIRFTVNVGGLRPSSALKTLEEKHRIYQEKVKGFAMDPKNV